MTKPRVLKDYEKLSEEIKDRIRLAYPYGYIDSLVMYPDKNGKTQHALPFETEDYYYLIRMSEVEAKQIIEDDDAYDDEGNIKDDIFDELSDTYADDSDTTGDIDV